MQNIECIRSDICIFIFFNMFLLKTYVQSFSSYVSDADHKDELVFGEGKD